MIAQACTCLLLFGVSAEEFDRSLCELSLQVASERIYRNDVVVTKVVLHNRSRRPVEFRQRFGGITGMVQFQRRVQGGEWGAVRCQNQSLLASPRGRQQILPGESYCCYEIILGSDTFSWDTAGEFELQAVAHGVGFSIQSAPVVIAVAEEAAVEQLPDKVGVSNLSRVVGPTSPFVLNSLDPTALKLRPESELAINWKRSQVFVEWVSASSADKAAAYAAVLKLIENSDLVTSERFTIGAAQQQIKQGKLAEARGLLKRLPHPSKLSSYLQTEVDKLDKLRPLPASN